LNKKTIQEIEMKKHPLQALAAIVVVFFSGSIIADTYAEVYSCILEEGKTAEDAQAANSKWLKWVNKNVANGKVTSSAGTAVVGDNKAFLWVDTYPDLDTWSATKTALDSKKGKEALKDLFKGITDCEENHLWKLTPTG
jgi:hypothetical protein